LGKKIQEEVASQEIDLWGRPDVFEKRLTEPMISFPRPFIRDLVTQMHGRVQEIRKYADPTI